MPMFPHLKLESDLQIDDRARFDALKSFRSGATPAIATVSIRPGADQSFITIFTGSVSNVWEDQKEAFLDWQFGTFDIDIDVTNGVIDFVENNVTLQAAVSPGTYSKSSLLTAIKTAMELVGSETYTITISPQDKITFQSTGNLKLLGLSGDGVGASLLRHIGFPKDTETKTSLTGDVWEYTIKAVTVRMNDGTLDQDKTFYLKLYSAYGDRLFCDDSDLQRHENDVLQWVEAGRNSHKNVIRRASKIIMEWVQGQGYLNVYGDPITKWDLVDLDEVRQWATYLSLSLLFQSLSNSSEDVFDRKSLYYKNKYSEARNRFIKLDLDKDGIADTDEYLSVFNGVVVRR